MIFFIDKDHLSFVYGKVEKFSCGILSWFFEDDVGYFQFVSIEHYGCFGCWIDRLFFDVVLFGYIFDFHKGDLL